MSMWETYFLGLGVMCAVGFIVWLLSLAKRDVSIVDSLWAPFFVVAALTYFSTVTDVFPRAYVVIALVSLWALRLFTYITWRNWGEGEDFRYQAMREKRGKSFAWQSLFIVFTLQAAIAWLVSISLLGAIHSVYEMGNLDLIGIIVFAVGFLFEAVGDWQLARFKANPDSKGKVMDKGLWRYTRHPNYFGNFTLWWGLYLIALSAGAWWSFPGPIIMSFFLLKVSGVAMLEKDIGERRPKYADYIKRTNAFFPGPPKAA